MIGTTPLKKETDLQYILSDIPFFAVGVFAFGACTFFLVLRRLTRVVACLHVAIFLTFAGAILDLVQVLARGNQSAAAVANTNPFLSLTIAREIAYSLSFGLRFLFYWGFVACPPLRRQGDDGDPLHSGSWGRWGITGYTLKYLIVLMTLAITTLQVIIRVYTPLENNPFLFDAEGALESSVSAVFMLKIFLNIYLAALDSFGATSRSRLLLEYSPVLFALLISLGIGVGNVIQYLFSETILGRFLQGIELYLLLLHTLIIAFRSKPSQMAKRRNRSSSFHNMPPSATRSSEMLLGPPRLSEPKFNPIFAEGMPFPAGPRTEQMEGPSQSYAAMMSTWFTRKPSKRTPPLTPAADPMLIQDQAERGVSPVAESVHLQFQQEPPERSPTEPRQSLVYRDPVYTSIVVPDPNDPVDPVDSLDGTPIEEAMPTRPPRVYSREIDKQMLHPPTPPSASGTESPIYGLYGKNSSRRPAILATPPEADEDPRQYFDRSARSSGISMLLRQQEELDRSIAALQIFSQNGDESRSSSVPSLTPNGSHRFSLSNFPEPPWGRSSIASTTVLPMQSPNLPTRNLSPEQPPVVRDSLMPPAERPRQQSIPLSEVDGRDSDLLAPSARPVRTNSMGTQYEITSFIGHLTHPGHVQQSASVSTQGSILGARASGVLRTIPEHTPRSSDQTLSIVSERPQISVSVPQRPDRDPRRPPHTISNSPSLFSIRSTSTITGRPLNGMKARPMGLPAQPRLNASSRSSPAERSSSFVPTPF